MQGRCPYKGSIHAGEPAPLIGIYAAPCMGCEAHVISACPCRPWPVRWRTTWDWARAPPPLPPPAGPGLGSYHVSSGSSEERVFLGHVEAVCGQYEQGQRWNAGLCIFQQRCVAFCVPGLRAFLFDGLRFLLYPCDLFHLCIPYSRVDDRKSQQPQNPLQVRIFSCEHHARMYHCYP